MVRLEGVEPPRLAAQVPKTCVSTSSTIGAIYVLYMYLIFCQSLLQFIDVSMWYKFYTIMQYFKNSTSSSGICCEFNTMINL